MSVQTTTAETMSRTRKRGRGGWRTDEVRAWVAALLFAGLWGVLGVGCKSQPQVEPYEVADEGPGDPIDREVDPGRGSGAGDWGDDGEFLLPDPPAELGKEIDAKSRDWSQSDFKSFDGEGYLTEGERFWGGAEDLSARVAAEDDQGHLYFSVEVEDDTVLDAESEATITDAVVVRLRDPRLAELRQILPDPVVDQTGLRSEVAILFTPDGQYWPVGDRARDLYREGISAATVRTSSGYRLEIALRVETIRQVSKFPVPEIAFRVDVLDGDSTERRGEQTRLSTHPPTPTASQRYALMTLRGWLPYESLASTPPRDDALGHWRLAENGWEFESLDRAPQRWRLVSEPARIRRLIDESPTFAEICPKSTHGRRLIEAYESRGGEAGVALVLCGTRAGDERCPRDAKTRAFWVPFRQRGSEWSLGKSAAISSKTLKQCLGEAFPGRSRFSGFSFRPLEVVTENLWAVGWRARREDSEQRVERSGIWFVRGDRAAAEVVADVQTSRVEADAEARMFSTSRVYLTDVDDAPGDDICTLRRRREQRCRGLDRKCRPVARGEAVGAHIQLWRPQEQTFERYLLSKHRRCDASFSFGEREAYLLYHRRNRVGLVRSPALETSADSR